MGTWNVDLALSGPSLHVEMANINKKFFFQEITQKFASHPKIRLEYIKSTRETSTVTFSPTMGGNIIEVSDTCGSDIHAKKALGIGSR